MKLHSMRLNAGPFDRIKRGNKRVEIRLNDEKRQKIQEGDLITFSKIPEETDQITCRVMGLIRCKTFRELTAKVQMEDFGYPRDFDKKVFTDSMYEIYSPELEKEYGVLGIRFELI